MKAYLVTAMRESSGYLEDQGWDQTAKLMTLAAHEIERLNARIRELEAHLGTLGDEPNLHAPEASNQNGEPVAAISSRR
jgi:hypothetical protein